MGRQPALRAATALLLLFLVLCSLVVLPIASAKKSAARSDSSRSARSRLRSETNPLSSVADTVSFLEGLQHEIKIPVNVVLVGLGGDGGCGITVNPNEFQTIVQNTEKRLPILVEHLKEQKLYDHVLPLSVEFHFNVVAAPSELSDALATQIQSQIEAHNVYEDHEQRGGRPFVRISPQHVDQIIHTHYEEKHSGYTFYIINPSRPTREGKPLSYGYFDVEQSNCPTNNWIGTDHRYFWIDLTAGPIDFGFNFESTANVKPSIMPDIERLCKRRQVGPERQLQVELSHMVHRSTRRLLAPPVGHFPVPFREHIRIHVVFISDRVGPHAEMRYQKQWNTMESQLMTMALDGQEIEVVPHFRSFADCELCAQAYTNALKSHATQVGDHIQMERYLDSLEMIDWMEHFNQEYLADSVGSSSEQPDDFRKANNDSAEHDTTAEDVRVVAAFVFDLAAVGEIVLYDREATSFASADFAFGVQTVHHKAVHPLMSCGGNDVTFDPSNVARATFASLLQTTWGLAETHSYYDTKLNVSNIDYFWSAAPTAFGPFSKSQVTTFATRDIAARNMILSVMNQTLHDLTTVLNHVKNADTDLTEILSEEDSNAWLDKWRHFGKAFKRCMEEIEQSRFTDAVKHIRMARRDAHWMHSAVHSAVERRIRKQLVCPVSLKEETVLLDWTFIGVAFVLALAVFFFAIVYKPNEVNEAVKIFNL